MTCVATPQPSPFSTSVSGRFNVRLVLSDNESNASCTQTVEFLPIVVKHPALRRNPL